MYESAPCYPFRTSLHPSACWRIVLLTKTLQLSSLYTESCFPWLQEKRGNFYQFITSASESEKVCEYATDSLQNQIAKHFYSKKVKNSNTFTVHCISPKLMFFQSLIAVFCLSTYETLKKFNELKMFDSIFDSCKHAINQIYNNFTHKCF